MFLFALCGVSAAANVLLRTHAETPTDALFKREGWTLGHCSPEPDTKIELTVAVKPSEEHDLEALLLDVSTPGSAKYGQHLSREEVHELTKPSSEAADSIISWLESVEGDSRAVHSPPGWIHRTVTLGQAERLLGAKYCVYNGANGKTTRLNSTYTVPRHLSEHIDFIAPTYRMPMATGPKAHGPPKPHKADEFGNRVTPEFLHTLYNVTEPSGKSKGPVIAVASFLEQYYDLKDLQKFWSRYNVPYETITNVPSSQPSGYGIEAELDVQYITAMANGVPTQVWYTPGRAPDNKENEPFVTWLYKMLNETSPPSLFSASYGDDEDGVSIEFATRVNAEFVKAGLRGISILFASGDSGAGCAYGHFVPGFPASSPWITAVGGSTGAFNSKNAKDETTAALSGGGFSNYFGMPAYQKDAVAHYKSQSNLPKQKMWNATGRGYPDVCAQAMNFDVVSIGDVMAVSGTSAACPTAAGLFGLLNSRYFARTGKTLGFLNPLIYKSAGGFNDITTGGNNYCGDDAEGFPADEGWDAATGMGSINWGRMAAIVDQL